MTGTGTIGGGYAALMGKKNKAPKQANGGDSKPKAAKVISLKDTKDNKPKAAKKEDAPAKTEQKPKVEEKTRELSKREVKAERNATDRHVNRSGHPDSKGKKTDEIQDELDAANEKPIDDKKRAEIEEREAKEAERKAKEEEEAKKITYSEWEKQVAAKKSELAELGVKSLKARTVDDKGFANLTQVKKDEGDNTLNFATAKKAAAPAKATKNGKKEEVKAAPKKGKFVKSSDIQLGFFSKPQGGERRNNRDNRRREDKPRAPKVEEPKTEEAAPAAEEVAAPAETTEN